MVNCGEEGRQIVM